MRIEEMRLIVRPGRGVVARYDRVVLLVAQADDPAAADLIAAARGTDAKAAVDRMFEIVRRREPQVVSPFCALIQDGGELRVAIHGAMEVLAVTGDSTLRVAGRDAASGVEESLGAEVSRLAIGKQTPPVSAEPLLDLVEGIVSAGSIQLVPRGEAAPVAEPEVRMEPPLMEVPSLAAAPMAPPPVAPPPVAPPPVVPAPLAPAPVAPAPVAPPLVAAPPPPPAPAPPPPAAPAPVAQAPVAQAPVAPAPVASPPVAQAPAAPAAAPPAAAPPSADKATLAGQPPPPLASALADLRRAATISHEVLGKAPEHVDAPEVEGRLCPNGHLNNPILRECWVCGTSVSGQTARGPRPPLGRLTTKDKRSYIVDSNFVIGRKPGMAEDVAAGKARPIEVPEEHPGVSRRHAELLVEGWDLVLRDLGSSNGTYYLVAGETDWRRVEPDRPVKIASGTIITLGGFEILFDTL